MHERTRLSLILMLTALSTGCGGGGGDDRDKSKVTGSVTKAGAAWDGSAYQLVFAPANGTRPAYLEIGTDGSFSGSVVAGQNTIYLYKAPPPSDGSGGGGHDAPTDLPKAYMSVDSSPWQQEITGSGQISLDIDPNAKGRGGSGGGGGHGG